MERFKYSIDESKLIKLCSDLIKIDSQNPPGDTRSIIKFISEYLASHNIKSTTFEASPYRTGLIASIGSETGPELILSGHADTVPIGDPTNWKVDALSGDIVDNFLYGRGASDMKAGLGGLIYTLVHIKSLGVKLSGKLTLVVIPDEETGSKHGAQYLLENKLIGGDAAIIAEPTGRNNPGIGQKGSAGFKLKIRGIPAHSALSPLAGRSAILDAFTAINSIKELVSKEIPYPEDLEKLVIQSKEYLVETGYPELADIITLVSFNVGKIIGGTASNVVPEYCEVDFDLRTPLGITRDELLDMIESKLNTLGIDYEMTRKAFKADANYTSEDSKIVRQLYKSIEEIISESPKGIIQYAASDSRFFRKHGIPSVQYGPGEIETIHGIDERVSVSNIIECTKVYLLTAIQYLNNKNEL